MRRNWQKLRLSSALGTSAALLLVAALPDAAIAKPPKEGDVYHYPGPGGTCLEDTWEASDEGPGFEPAGGWGPCPVAKPHDRSHVEKKTRRASPN
ncbi:MAG: hypothetical protein ACE5ED_04895 [Rhodothalassiaceae bacterium]